MHISFNIHLADRLYINIYTVELSTQSVHGSHIVIKDYQSVSGIKKYMKSKNARACIILNQSCRSKVSARR